jgi:hypothetical protein
MNTRIEAGGKAQNGAGILRYIRLIECDLHLANPGWSALGLVQ